MPAHEEARHRRAPDLPLIRMRLAPRPIFWTLASIALASLALAVAIRFRPRPPIAGPAVRPAHATRPAPPVEAPPVSPAVAVRVLAIDFGTMEVRDGSGFFVFADGLLVTCLHVLKGRTVLGVVLSDGRQLDASGPIAVDEGADLAILRLDGSGFPFLPLAEREPAPGDRAWAVTKDGITAAAVGEPFTDADAGPVIGFAVPRLRPGASGGALVDETGAAVGVIPGAVDDDPGQCAAVPAGRIKGLVAGVAHEPRGQNGP